MGTIVEALDNFIKPPARFPDAPLRLPISNIYNIKGVGQIICGTVEQGTLRPGDTVGFVPVGLKGKKIFSIKQHKKVLDSAGPGNSVGLSIKGIAKDEKVSPGDIIYNEKDGELKPIKSFTALVAVQEHPGVQYVFPAITIGKQFLLIVQELFVGLGGVLKIWPLDNGVYGASLLAVPAENALCHVNVVSGGTTTVISTWLGLDGDCLCWADCFAKLACDAALLACWVTTKRVLTAEAWAQRVLLVRVVKCELQTVAPSGLAHRRPTGLTLGSRSVSNGLVK